jgi:transposase
MRKRAYRATAVKDVKVLEVIARIAEGRVCVGLDISKGEVFAVVRDSTGHFERPWKAKQPRELRELVGLMGQLSRQRPLIVALEPTGTYGDALRQALCDAGLAVHRVSGKAASDYAEVFDGVPSAHDGKDAAVVAELAAIGKSRPWPTRDASSWEGEVEGQVQWMDTQQAILQLWQGRLEGLLARHWPELTSIVGLTTVTLLRLLMHYGSPAAVAQDAEAANKIAAWGGHYLKPEKVRRLVESAQATVGVRMTEEGAELLKRFAEQAWQARGEVRTAQRELKRLAGQDATVERMAQAVGAATACVLYSTVGDPHDYHCGEAYRKALGLNLKERSSGKYQGKLKITKRGPSLARRWLFFAALRQIKQSPVRGWYEQKKRKDQDRGLGAVVAVMRKLALALYAVGARSVPFDSQRLFPGRPWPRCEMTSVPTPQGALPPTPRDLSPSGQSRKARKKKGAAER